MTAQTVRFGGAASIACNWLSRAAPIRASSCGHSAPCGTSWRASASVASREIPVTSPVFRSTSVNMPRYPNNWHGQGPMTSASRCRTDTAPPPGPWAGTLISLLPRTSLSSLWFPDERGRAASAGAARLARPTGQAGAGPPQKGSQVRRGGRHHAMRVASSAATPPNTTHQPAPAAVTPPAPVFGRPGGAARVAGTENG